MVAVVALSTQSPVLRTLEGAELGRRAALRSRRGDGMRVSSLGEVYRLGNRAADPAVTFLLYRTYRLHLARAEDARVHAESLANLHMRTIEALALAIEAKDNTTHDHLRRVQVYAMEVAKELNLGDDDLEALRAAAFFTTSGNSPYRNTSFRSLVNCRRKSSKK